MFNYLARTFGCSCGFCSKCLTQRGRHLEAMSPCLGNKYGLARRETFETIVVMGNVDNIDIGNLLRYQFCGKKDSITLSGTFESIVDFLKMLHSTGLALGRKISFVDVNISNGTERNFGNDCGVSENVYNIDLGTLPPCQLFGAKDSITLKGTLESIVDFL